MNALRTRVSSVVALLALGLASVASASTATQKRDLKGYHRIELEGSLDLEISEGNGYSFELTAPESQLSVYTTEVKGDTLVISTRPGFHWNLGKAKARITVPELRGVQLEGSGDVTVRSLNHVHDFELGIEGSGDVDLRGSMAKGTIRVEGSGDVTLEGGTAQALDVKLAGSGDLSAKNFTTHVADVQTSGSGDVELSVDGGPAQFSTSGSGDIDWWGNAQQVQSSSSGSGDINHH